MSDWRRVAAQINLTVPIWKRGAMDYLESRGKRFCVDFGTDNAIELARRDWTGRKRREKRKRPTA